MKRVLDHDVLSSFREFLSYRVLNYLSGFTNVSAPVYPSSGVRKFTGKNIYATPYAQWVYDSSPVGVQVPTGIGALGRGQSGLIIDFKNGRFLVNTGVTLTGSVNVSVPDFNVYVSPVPIQKFILEGKFQYPPYLTQPTGVIKADSVIAPCIVLNLSSTYSKPLELGGVDNSAFMMQIGVLADKVYNLMGVQKIIREMSQRVFPLSNLTPLNEYNDLKSGVWNYNSLISGAGQGDMLYINKTTFRVLDSNFLNENHPNLYFGVGTALISRYGWVDSAENFSGGDFSVYAYD